MSLRESAVDMEYLNGIEKFKYLKEVDKARRLLHAAITEQRCAPIMLRLALMDAALPPNYRSVGAIRLVKDNCGLTPAIQLCENIKKLCPLISFADLFQLAGLVAVRISGGPTYDFVPGRKDIQQHAYLSGLKIPLLFSFQREFPTEEEQIMFGRLVAGNVRRAFEGMGLSDKDIVVLHGAYLRRGHDHERRWCYCRHEGADQLLIRNSIFCDLMCKDRNEMRDPIEKTLIEDVRFFSYVKKYTKDEDLFLKDFANTQKKISELGFIQVDSNTNFQTWNWNGGAAITAVAAALIPCFGSCFGI